MANELEELKKEHPSTYEIVTNGGGPYTKGFYCTGSVTLTIQDQEGTSLASLVFPAGARFKAYVKEITTGATGNNVIGFH